MNLDLLACKRDKSVQRGLGDEDDSVELPPPGRVRVPVWHCDTRIYF